MKSHAAPFVLYTASGMFIYAVCAGFRDNYGIMLPYIAAWSGLSYAAVSFVIALGQLFFGLMQPVFGVLALRRSARSALLTGIGMMLAGLWLIPAARSAWLLTLALGILLPSGTAAASFGIIMGCVGPRLTPGQTHVSSGIISAGIGVSICVLSPVMQAIIAARGLGGAILALSAPVLLLLPLSLWLTGNAGSGERASGPKSAEARQPIFALFRDALRVPAYRRLTFGFFTCGFHMAMIQTHLFSQLQTPKFGVSAQAAAWALSVYGIGVIAGCVGSGMACARFPLSRILGCLYTSRCLWVILLLLPLPLPALFCVILMLGMTGVATVAPTSGLVNKLFGPRRLAALFGFAYLVHQIGAFASAWAGGLFLKLTGGYGGVWLADMALCLAAGIACFSIRKKTERGG